MSNLFIGGKPSGTITKHGNAWQVKFKGKHFKTLKPKSKCFRIKDYKGDTETSAEEYAKIAAEEYRLKISNEYEVTKNRYR
jgi:hypothetical protein